MILFRKKKSAQPSRLVIYGPDGHALTREISPGLLDSFVEDVLERGGDAARLRWGKTGVLSSAYVLACWGSGLVSPEKAVLRSGAALKTGLALQVDLLDVSDVKDFASDLIRALAGKSPPSSRPSLHLRGYINADVGKGSLDRYTPGL